MHIWTSHINHGEGATIVFRCNKAQIVYQYWWRENKRKRKWVSTEISKSLISSFGPKRPDAMVLVMDIIQEHEGVVIWLWCWAAALPGSPFSMVLELHHWPTYLPKYFQGLWSAKWSFLQTLHTMGMVITWHCHLQNKRPLHPTVPHRSLL